MTTNLNLAFTRLLIAFKEHGDWDSSTWEEGGISNSEIHVLKNWQALYEIQNICVISLALNLRPLSRIFTGHIQNAKSFVSATIEFSRIFKQKMYLGNFLKLLVVRLNIQ